MTEEFDLLKRFEIGLFLIIYGGALSECFEKLLGSL